jgi:hypothetical protein
MVGFTNIMNSNLLHFENNYLNNMNKINVRLKGLERRIAILNKITKNKLLKTRNNARKRYTFSI